LYFCGSKSTFGFLRQKVVRRIKDTEVRCVLLNIEGDLNAKILVDTFFIFARIIRSCIFGETILDYDEHTTEGERNEKSHNRGILEYVNSLLRVFSRKKRFH